MQKNLKICVFLIALIMISGMFTAMPVAVKAEEAQEAEETVPENAKHSPEVSQSETLLNGWQQEKKKLCYYIDNVMVTGWIEIDGKEFFFHPDGDMAAGWLIWENSKFYIDPEAGKLSKGWIMVNDKMYHLSPGGIVLTGWLEWEKNRYYLDADGAMVTGWAGLDGRMYYFNPDGTMARGWLPYDNNMYYLDSDGAMLVGRAQIDKKIYHFNSDGAMITGWVEWEGNRYYMGSDGVMITGWIMPDNYVYFLNSDGAMHTGWYQEKNIIYYFGGDGRMAVNDWYKIDGTWFNFASNGMLYSATGDGDNRLSKAQAAFTERYYSHAAALSVQYGIPWEAVIAQGILESAAGNSTFARTRNNFFGIGAVDSNPDNARRYESPEAGWEGYYRFIRDNGRYARHGVFKDPAIVDPYAYIRAVKAAGYATDPNYVAKLTPLVTAVINHARKMNWQTSVQLALADPGMYRAADRNS